MILTTDGDKPYISNLIKHNDENWVTIKPILSGICKTDIYVSYGIIPVDENRVIGHEFCGYVLEDSNMFRKGDYVAINPLIDDKFIGIDYDGCFSDVVYIPEGNIHKLPPDMDPKLGAYIEPISASLSPINCELKGEIAIYGEGRIPLLTQVILNRFSIKTDIIYGCDITKKYDTIIETEQSEQAFDNILLSLNKNGKIILKSRNTKKVKIPLHEFVKNNISMESAYYYDFEKTIEFANQNRNIFEKLLGETYKLSEYKIAFEKSKGDKKIFLCVD